MTISDIQAKSESWNMRIIGHHDLNGHGDGMQLLKQGRYVYLAHLGTSPMALSIIDVADPSDPRVVTQLPHAPNTHSHKVQIAGDILIQNQERPYFDRNLPASTPNEAGIKIYSIEKPTEPREIGSNFPAKACTACGLATASTRMSAPCCPVSKSALI
jgi:hypothetical protein